MWPPPARATGSWASWPAAGRPSISSRRASHCARVPAPLDLVEAGGIPEAFITAHDAMVVQGELMTGQRVLVHAVASGVGTAALQLARCLGASVVGTSRSKDKLERAAELGLDHPILAPPEFDPAALAAEITATGGPIDVTVDLLGGPYLGVDVAAAAPKGRIVIVGLIAGRTAELDMGALLAKRLIVRGTVLRSRPAAEKADATHLFEGQVVPLIGRGAIRPVIDAVVPLAEAERGYDLVEQRPHLRKGGAGPPLNSRPLGPDDVEALCAAGRPGPPPRPAGLHPGTGPHRPGRPVDHRSVVVARAGHDADDRRGGAATGRWSGRGRWAGGAAATATCSGSTPGRTPGLVEAVLWPLLRGVRRGDPIFAFWSATELSVGLEGLPRQHRPATHEALLDPGLHRPGPVALPRRRPAAAEAPETPYRRRGHGCRAAGGARGRRAAGGRRRAEPSGSRGSGSSGGWRSSRSTAAGGSAASCCGPPGQCWPRRASDDVVLFVDHDDPKARDRRPALELYLAEGFTVVDHLWSYRRGEGEAEPGAVPAAEAPCQSPTSTMTRAGPSCVVTWNGRCLSRPITQVSTPSKSPVRRTCWMRVVSAASIDAGPV